MSQYVQQLFRYQITVLHVLFKLFQDQDDIFHLQCQAVPVLKRLHSLLKLFQGYIILIGFRKERLHLIDKALLFHTGAEHEKILSALPHDLSYDHGFSLVIEQFFGNIGKLLKHSVRETVKSNHVDVHSPVVRMPGDQLPLGIQRRLVRDEKKEIFIPILHRLFYHLFIYIIRFSCAACAQDTL